MAIAGNFQPFNPSGTYYTGPVKMPSGSLGGSGGLDPSLVGGPVKREWKSPWLSNGKKINLGELIRRNPGINIFPGPNFEKSDLKPSFPQGGITNAPVSLGSGTGGYDPRIIMSDPSYKRTNAATDFVKKLFSPVSPEEAKWRMA